MEKYLKILLSLSILVLFTGKSFSQGLNAIVSPDVSHVYAFGDNGKMLKSGNAGQTWSRTTNGSANYKCADVVGVFALAGSSDGKVTVINSETGTITVYNTPSSNPVNGIHCAGFDAIYTCGNNGIIYKSTDFGVTWTLKNSGIPANAKLNSIHGNNPFIIAVGDSGVAYKSSNAGNNWTTINTGTTKNLLTVFTKLTEYYIGGEKGVYLSGILENPASPTSVTLSTGDIRVITGYSLLNLKLAGGQGFIRNNMLPGGDGYSNFEANPLLSNLTGMSLDKNSSSGIYYACSNETDAVIKTTNNGASWDFTAGATRTITWSSKLSGSGGIGNNLCMNPNNRNELYVVYGKTMYRSMNRGDNWTNFGTVGSSSGTVSNAHSFYVSPLDTNILMCAIEGSPTDKVVRSTNYGATWTNILEKNFSNYGQPLEMDQNNPNIWYFAPDNGGFWKSTNNGLNFTEVSGNYPFRSPCDLIVEWGNSNNVMVADGITGSGVADIFKSTNAGINWTKVHTNPSGASEIPSMCNSQYDPKLFYATNWSQSSRYKTTNGGANWVAIQSTSFSGWGSDLCREDPTVVLTGNYGQNSSLTTNGGINWTEYPLPSGGCGAGIIVPERGYLIAMQCSGLLKMNVSYSVVTNVEEQTLTGVPTSYNLYQNYPNPFNPSTEIKFDVSKAGVVKMKVYNEAGKEIYTLVNGYKNAGAYSVKFDASSLASGVYYYTMETGGNIMTKKMVLIK
jgi:photosystem II stability/assembly factor-like uncharacterized protein